MVLETIDQIKRSEEEPSSSSKNEPSSKSPIDDTPESVAEQRDAAVATPCDSIRSYANEITAADSSASNAGSDKDEKNAVAANSNAATTTTTTTVSETQERDAPPAEGDPPAADVPASEAAVAEEPEPTTISTVVKPPAPATIAKVRSNVSQNTAVVAEETTSSEPPSATGLDANQPSRVTLITISDSDDCKQDAGVGGTDGATDVTRSRSEASHQSVEVFDVVLGEEAAEEPEAADEPAAEVTTEPASELEADGAETKAAEVGAEDDATESALVEAETEGATTTPATTPAQTQVEGSDAVATEESPAEPAGKPEGGKAAGKRKKFALKKLSKPNLAKPNVMLSSKKPTTPKGNSVAKGLSMRFRKPHFGKMKSKKSGSVVVEDSAAKNEAGDDEATPTETAPESTARDEPPKEEEPSVAAAKDEVSTTTEAQELNEATVETVDLGDNANSEPAAIPDSTPSSPAAPESNASIPVVVEPKPSRSVPNTPTEGKEEIQQIEDEEKDGESSGEGVPVDERVAEVVAEKSIVEGGEEEKAEEDGDVGTSEDAESETKSTWEGAAHTTFEALYAKAEDYFGDVTNLCGTKQNAEKKDGEEGSSDLVENDAAKSDKSTEVGAAAAVVPSASVEKDDSDAVEKEDVDEKNDATTEGPVASNVDGPTNNDHAVEDLLTPLSIATEQVSLSASSFIETLQKGNESVRSIVENLSMGVESVSKTAADTFFPKDVEGEVLAEKSAQEEKLDKAAKMAKKALDGAPDDEEQQEEQQEQEQEQQQEENTGKNHKKPPSGKSRFGFRRNNDKKSKSKPHLMISTVKEDVDAEKAADAAASSDDKKPKSPTTQVLGRLTRGFGGSKNKDARSKPSKSIMSTTSKAQDMKKVANRLFKKPSGPSKKVGVKTEKVASPENEAAVVEEPEPVQDDLIAHSVSMNSQSLNIPQSQPSKEEVASAVEEATKPAADVDEASEPASAPVEEEAKPPKSESTPAAPTEESDQEETLVESTTSQEFKTVGIVKVAASESLVSEKSTTTTPTVTTEAKPQEETTAEKSTVEPTVEA